MSLEISILHLSFITRMRTNVSIRLDLIIHVVKTLIQEQFLMFS